MSRRCFHNRRKVLGDQCVDLPNYLLNFDNNYSEFLKIDNPFLISGEFEFEFNFLYNLIASVYASESKSITTLHSSLLTNLVNKSSLITLPNIGILLGTTI